MVWLTGLKKVSLNNNILYRILILRRIIYAPFSILGKPEKDIFQIFNAYLQLKYDLIELAALEAPE